MRTIPARMLSLVAALVITISMQAQRGDREEQHHYGGGLFAEVGAPRYEWRGAMLDLSRHYFPIEHIHRQIDGLARCGINVLHLHLTDAAGWRMEIKRYPQLTERAAYRTAESWKEWWNGDRGYRTQGEAVQGEAVQGATVQGEAVQGEAVQGASVQGEAVQGEAAQGEAVQGASVQWHGGYYTQDELREVVAHAASVGITVVPEIEMPGHSEEVFAAFPELLCEGGQVSGAGVRHGQAQADFCAGNELTFEVIFGILDEVMDVFPSPYIHIGGDEAGRQLWQSCSRCGARMREYGFETTAQMQAWFMRRVSDYLTAHGRRAVCWDEVLEGWEQMEAFMAQHPNNLENLDTLENSRKFSNVLESSQQPQTPNPQLSTPNLQPQNPQTQNPKTPKPIIMCWRGQAKGAEALRGGFDVVMCPGEYCYFDNAQDAPHTQPEANGGYLPFDKVYAYAQAMSALSDEVRRAQTDAQSPRLLGLQGNLWAEYIPTPAHAEYMLYPRIMALSMVGMGYDYTPEVAHNLGMLFADDMRALGYNAFDLRHELGQRPEMSDTAQHIARGCGVTYRHHYSDHYAAAGDGALTDGIRGGWANNDGRWQGFIGEEGMDVVIDLGARQHVSEVSADFQQICQPDIFAPETFIVSVSNDGRHFREVARERHDIVFTTIPSVEHRAVTINKTTRYLRIQALPRQEGGWVFCDEVVVK